jgi:hypothetical protein
VSLASLLLLARNNGERLVLGAGTHWHWSVGWKRQDDMDRLGQSGETSSPTFFV